MKKFLIGLALNSFFVGNAFAEDLWKDIQPLSNDWGTLPNDWGTLPDDWGTLSKDWGSLPNDWVAPSKDETKWESSPQQEYPNTVAETSAPVAEEPTQATTAEDTSAEIQATNNAEEPATVSNEPVAIESPVETAIEEPPEEMQTAEEVAAEVPIAEATTDSTIESVAEPGAESTTETAAVDSTRTEKPVPQPATVATAAETAIAGDHNWVETKQEAASEAAKEATVESSGKKIHWVPVSISAGIALAGGALAYYFDDQAKKATQIIPTNHAEYQKGYDDAGKNQLMRTISIGVAALGLVGIGVSFIF